jgi:hypothetical protein
MRKIKEKRAVALDRCPRRFQPNRDCRNQPRLVTKQNYIAIDSLVAVQPLISQRGPLAGLRLPGAGGSIAAFLSSPAFAGSIMNFMNALA